MDFSPAKDGTRTGLLTRVRRADGTVVGSAGAAGGSVVTDEGEHHVEDRCGVFVGAPVLLFVSTASLRAQGTSMPDFTGVLRSTRLAKRAPRRGGPARGRGACAGGGDEHRAAPPPRPVLLDGREGRPATRRS